MIPINYFDPELFSFSGLSICSNHRFMRTVRTNAFKFDIIACFVSSSSLSRISSNSLKYSLCSCSWEVVVQAVLFFVIETVLLLAAVSVADSKTTTGGSYHISSGKLSFSIFKSFFPGILLRCIQFERLFSVMSSFLARSFIQP